MWNVDTSYPTDEASSFLKLLVVVGIEAELAEQSFQVIEAIGLFGADSLRYSGIDGQGNFSNNILFSKMMHAEMKKMWKMTQAQPHWTLQTFAAKILCKKLARLKNSRTTDF